MAKSRKYYKKKSQQPAEQPIEANESVQNTGESESTFTRLKTPILLLFGFTVLLYANTFNHEYALDDKLYVTHNEFVKEGISGIPDILSNDLLVGFYGKKKNLLSGGRYRPLTVTTHAIEYEIMGENPQVSHVLNVLLYALSVVVLFWVLAFIFPVDKEKWWLSIPFITALVWAVHPLHTEVVANIKSRDEILSTLFAFTAMYQFLKHTATGEKKPLILSAVIFFLGLASKESTVTFAAIIPLTAYFFQKKSIKELILPTTVLGVSTAIYVVLRFTAVGLSDAPPAAELMNDPYLFADGAEKYATTFFTLLLYLKLLVFPHPLTHDYYPWHPIPKDNEADYFVGPMQFELMDWGHPLAILSILAHLFLLFVALRGFAKRTVWSYAATFYLITFLLFSNLIFNIGAFMNERFMYSPSLAFSFFVASGLMYLAAKKKLSEKAIPIILVALVAAYSIKTFTRNPAWKNDRALSLTDVKVSKYSAKVNMSAGGSLVDEAMALKNPQAAQPLVQEAFQYLTRSLKIYPTFVQPMIITGNGYYALEDFQNAAVWYANALRVNPNFNDAIRNLAHLGQKGIQDNQPQTTIKAMELLIQYQQKPEYFNQLAEAYGKSGIDLAKSEQYLQRSMELDPNNSDTYQKLGVVNATLGRRDAAEQFFLKALEINPDNAPLMENLTIFYQQQGDAVTANRFAQMAAEAKAKQENK